MIRQLIFGLLFLFTAIDGQAQNQPICAVNINDFFIDTCQINAGILKVPKKTRSTKNIIRRINESCKTEQDKAYFIYAYIATNFIYDENRFKAIKRKSIKRELYTKELLSKGKGVCGDFANLYKLLCDSVGVKCLRVSGYTSGGVLFHTPDESTFDHAWNIISVNGKWYNVDVTWALNLSSDISKPKFLNQIYTGYLFENDGKFSVTHMAGDPVYQLCTQKKTFKEFRWREKDISSATNKEVDRLIDERYAMDEKTRYFAELQSQLNFSKGPEIEIFSGCYHRIQCITDKKNPLVKKITTEKYEEAIEWYTELKSYSGKLSKRDQKKLEYTIEKEIKDCKKKMDKLKK